MKESEMSFWDHLEDLRWALMRAVIVLLAFAVVSFIYMPSIFDSVILAPCRNDFFLYSYFCKISQYTTLLPDFCNNDFQVEIININLASQFLTHISTSFWLAFIGVCPYLVFEIWRFISPGLYTHERKNVKTVFVFGTFMFFIGCSVGYILVFPLTLRFLADYKLSELIYNQISLDSYMENFFMLILIMGFLFELPLISWLLSQMGLITRAFFKKYRRHAIVFLLIVAAVITPSGDPFTLATVFFPLYFLYEISALVVKKKQLG